MSKIYLMRHGHAQSMRGMADFKRDLTPAGVLDARQQGERLLAKGENIEKIIHSPYNRARQTAEWVNKSFEVPMVVCDHLVPSGSPNKVIDTIVGMEGNLLLVCHLPIIADLALSLGSVDLPFYPGTVARFEREDPFSRSATFEWIQNPS